MNKRKLEPCSNCGLYGYTEISHSYKWTIFCGACKTGYVSRFLVLAIWKWNKSWRKKKRLHILKGK